MMKRWVWLGLCGLTACAGLHRVVQDDVVVAQQRWPDVTLQQLEDGRARYIRRCSGCHALHRPEEYAPEQWPQLVDEMVDEAKLTEEERVVIERYLIVASEQVRATPSR